VTVTLTRHRIGTDVTHLSGNDEFYFDTNVTVGIMKRVHSELSAAIGSLKANEIVFSVGVSFGMLFDDVDGDGLDDDNNNDDDNNSNNFIIS